ncbi:FAD/NAD(P)-binding protein [Paenibacillus radicibacter]|uniref:FAD/NAD(P)-binding protein n=1 Tax=Paenibacillus radicibacter TaxID=2972488 RepID=UPI002158B835|nr:FAD/NAD(P)-binding domain-containing protein [Paenibacillus radicibacter]
MLNIAIVGCGPWGLAVLERFIAHCTRIQQDQTMLKLHVIEPNEGGTGVYSDTLPEYLLLNTECGNIHLFGSTFMEPREPRKGYEMSFYEWLRTHQYKVEEDGVMREVKPTDFVARKWLGNYLNGVFQTLLSHLPSNMQAQLHKAKATQIIRQGDQEQIELDNGFSLLVDKVFLTVGHADTIQFESGLGAQHDVPGQVLPPFPHQHVQQVVQPGECVLLAGMGLAAIDVISYLTIGRGGVFNRQHSGELVYQPSGKEPHIIQFSRSGLSYRSRPIGIQDTAGTYKPTFLTKERIDELRKEHQELDFRAQVLPLLYDEMKLRYRSKQAEDLLERVENPYRDFDPEEAIFGTCRRYENAAAFQEEMFRQLRCDVAESKSDHESPSKAAIELIRVLRDMFRYAVDFGGLTASSFRDFRMNIMPMFYRAVVGPPVHKTEQLIALMKAGIVKHSLGPAPVIEYEADNRRWYARSVHLDQRQEVYASHYVLGYNDSNLMSPPSSVLLQNLQASGRIRSPYSSLHLQGLGVACDPDFHPINEAGEAERHIFILGLLTDGSRHFNLYLPSPRSRARAFYDADQCVVEVWKEMGGNK